MKLLIGTMAKTEKIRDWLKGSEWSLMAGLIKLDEIKINALFTFHFHIPSFYTVAIKQYANLKAISIKFTINSIFQMF